MKIINDLPEERWEEYKNLRIQALKDSPQAFLDSVENTQSFDEELWKKRLPSVTFCEIDEKLVGMTSFYISEKEKEGHIANVVGVFVKPEYRRKRIGKKLLEEVIRKIKKNTDLKVIKIGVVTTQEAAFNLYKSLGFQIIGISHRAVKVNKELFDEYLMEMII